MMGGTVHNVKGQRLRDFHPLVEKDGSCSILYDLERTLIIDVPNSLQGQVIEAFGARDLKSEMVAWLTGEDLLTTESRISWAETGRPILPTLTDLSLEISGACNMSCVYCFEKEIHSRNGRMEYDTALAALDFFFQKTAGTRKVALHFGSGEPLLRADLLGTVVLEATRRAAINGQIINFELTTNATLVTPELCAFLRDHPFNVRVSCDGPPNIHNKLRPLANGQNSYSAVERGLCLLLEQIPDRLTVNSVLSRGTRLRDLWEWAKWLGLKHYHVIKVGAHESDDTDLRNAELSDFRSDLEGTCQDIYCDLEARRSPIDFQPITKVLRRLMIPQPVTRFCGVAGSYLGVAANGTVYPCFRHLGISRYNLGSIWTGVDDCKRQGFRRYEAADVDNRPICQDCWARYLCGGGCYADSTVYSREQLRPKPQHCPFWRTEIDVAIHFYNRLLQKDPAHCLRLFGDEPEVLLEAVGGQAHFMQRKNCL